MTDVADTDLRGIALLGDAFRLRQCLLNLLDNGAPRLLRKLLARSGTLRCTRRDHHAHATTRLLLRDPPAPALSCLLLPPAAVKFTLPHGDVTLRVSKGFPQQRRNPSIGSSSRRNTDHDLSVHAGSVSTAAVAVTGGSGYEGSVGGGSEPNRSVSGGYSCAPAGAADAAGVGEQSLRCRSEEAPPFSASVPPSRSSSARRSLATNPTAGAAAAAVATAPGGRTQWLRIEVADSGVGMSERAVEALFQARKAQHRFLMRC